MLRWPCAFADLYAAGKAPAAQLSRPEVTLCIIVIPYAVCIYIKYVFNDKGMFSFFLVWYVSNVYIRSCSPIINSIFPAPPFTFNSSPSAFPVYTHTNTPRLSPFIIEQLHHTAQFRTQGMWCEFTGYISHYGTADSTQNNRYYLRFGRRWLWLVTIARRIAGNPRR